MIVYCMDEQMRNVIRTYIIPRSEIFYETDIYIYDDWSNTRYKFKKLDKYRVDDKQYNHTYKSLTAEDLKGLKDIENFLEYIKQKEK